MKLTDLAIRAIKPPRIGADIYYDDDLPGFGVRVSKAGTKSFILTHGPQRRRETIGRVGILALKTARSEAKIRLAEYTLGKDRPRVIAWKAAVDEYLKEVKARRRPSTHESYERHFRKNFRFGDTRMTEIGPHDVQRSLDRLLDRPGEHHHAFVTLRAFIRWAYRKHYIEKNPMDRMKAPPGSKSRSRILSDDELRRVWHASGDDSFGKIVKLLILTGQRLGEITHLEHAMFGDGVITLPSELTKNHRTHTFPIGPLTASIVEPLRFNGYGKSKARLDKISGVSGWTLHDLRRTFASGLASLGVNLPVVERLLNHVSGSFGGIVGVYQRYDFMPEMRSAVMKWELNIRSLIKEQPVSPLTIPPSVAQSAV